MSLIHIGHFVGDDIASAEVLFMPCHAMQMTIPCHRKSRTLYLQGHPSNAFVRSGWSIKTREDTNAFDTGHYYPHDPSITTSRVLDVTSVWSFRRIAIEGKTRTRHPTA